MGELERDTCVGRRTRRPEKVEANVNRQKKNEANKSLNAGWGLSLGICFGYSTEGVSGCLQERCLEQHKEASCNSMAALRI